MIYRVREKHNMAHFALNFATLTEALAHIEKDQNHYDNLIAVGNVSLHGIFHQIELIDADAHLSNKE